jgi:hypothetical protein
MSSLSAAWTTVQRLDSSSRTDSKCSDLLNQLFRPGIQSFSLPIREHRVGGGVLVRRDASLRTFSEKIGIERYGFARLRS